MPAAGAARRRAGAGRPGAAAPALISVRNGWVWLEGAAVLRRLQFTVRRGDCWVVHGPNGSGKSTLVRALYGDLGVASQGELRRRGIEPGVPLAEFQRRVGLIAPELQANSPVPHGAGGRRLGARRQHRARRAARRGRAPRRARGAAALRCRSTGRAHAARAVLRPAAPRAVRARLGGPA
ncbi:MAG: ATP-binding cassette domain-containing protein [Steroidobacteraceae bacterium]